MRPLVGGAAAAASSWTRDGHLPIWVEHRDSTGKADGAIDEGSAEALAVLEVVNTLDLETLDASVNSGGVGLVSTAATNIVAHRTGPDGEEPSADDNAFDDLAELDAVSWVGPVALERLLAYAQLHGIAGDQDIAYRWASRSKPPSPVAEYGQFNPMVIYDTVTDQVLGIGATSNITSGVVIAAYDRDENAWSQLRGPEDGPGWVEQFAVAYDPGQQRVVLHGGMDLADELLAGTWSYAVSGSRAIATSGTRTGNRRHPCSGRVRSPHLRSAKRGG